MTQTLPYGSWPSPILAADVAAGSHPVDGARFVGDEVWWLERVPAEGGRTTVRRERNGVVESLLAAPWDARSRVHEYGGGAWDAADDGTLCFVEKTDQRVWKRTPAGEVLPLTPLDGDVRFGDLTLTGDRLAAVRERHGAPHTTPVRDIVLIPLDGSAGDDADRVVSLVAGSDFLAYPRISPGGDRLAWIAWDHPNMPWDGTQLRVGAIDADSGITSFEVVAGAADVSVVQPEWVGEERLLFCDDASGRWNLRAWTPQGAVTVAPADADTGGPLWNLGARWFAPLDDGRIVAVRTNGVEGLVVIDPDGATREIPTPATARLLLQDVRGTHVLLTGGGSTNLGGLWMLDPDAAEPVTLVRSAVDETPDANWLPQARALTVDGPHGPVHAYAYPPTNPEATGPADERPPYLLLAHGGPTTHVSGAASLDVAYFTSRGIGVLDVNYGGSTGYGRAYRARLDGQWGIVDRDDVVAAATGLVEGGWADGARLAIRGGSAGGWTVLCALTGSDRFAAGISRYGVADLRALAAHTHHFEARYLDRLVGPLPACEQVYIDRSPLSRRDSFTAPMLIEQGLDDAVVPPEQSEAVRDAVAARALPHAYLAFEGEGHGFRRAETIVASFEAELSFLGQVFGFAPVGVSRLALS